MNEVSKEKLISVKELAEILNVSERTIERTIKKLPTVLSPLLRNNQGGYLFNEKQVTLIKQEIQSHHNLQSRRIDNVSTDYEMELMTQKVLAYNMQREQELRKQLEEQKQIVNYYNQFLNSNNYIDIGLLGKITGIGAKKIFQHLLYDKIIYQKYEKSSGLKYYVPFYNYEKYFHLTAEAINIKGNNKSTFKLQLMPKGFVYFSKKYSPDKITDDTLKEFIITNIYNK